LQASYDKALEYTKQRNAREKEISQKRLQEAASRALDFNNRLHIRAKEEYEKSIAHAKKRNEDLLTEARQHYEFAFRKDRSHNELADAAAGFISAASQEMMRCRAFLDCIKRSWALTAPSMEDPEIDAQATFLKLPYDVQSEAETKFFGWWYRSGWTEKLSGAKYVLQKRVEENSENTIGAKLLEQMKADKNQAQPIEKSFPRQICEQKAIKNNHPVQKATTPGKAETKSMSETKKLSTEEKKQKQEQLVNRLMAMKKDFDLLGQEDYLDMFEQHTPHKPRCNKKEGYSDSPHSRRPLSASSRTQGRPFGSSAPRHFLWEVPAGSKTIPGSTSAIPKELDRIATMAHVDRMEQLREKQVPSSFSKSASAVVHAQTPVEQKALAVLSGGEKASEQIPQGNQISAPPSIQRHSVHDSNREEIPMHVLVDSLLASYGASHINGDSSAAAILGWPKNAVLPIAPPEYSPNRHLPDEGRLLPSDGRRTILVPELASSSHVKCAPHRPNQLEFQAAHGKWVNK